LINRSTDQDLKIVRSFSWRYGSLNHIHTRKLTSILNGYFHPSGKCKNGGPAAVGFAHKGAYFSATGFVVQLAGS